LAQSDLRTAQTVVPIHGKPETVKLFSEQEEPDGLEGVSAGPSRQRAGRCGPDGLFADFTYDNLGVPRNLTPFYDESAFNPSGDDWIDRQLGGLPALR